MVLHVRIRCLLLLLLVSLAGCTTDPVPSHRPTTEASPAPERSSAPTAAASVPALANVTTDDARVASKDISADGGTVSATGADGTTYSLEIPVDAVSATTKISLYPVTGLAGLPDGSSISTGVQFAPDGLILAVPATLTIRLPAGRSAAGLTAVAWRGDGLRPHLYPSGADGQVISLRVLHFSGVGLDPSQLELSMSCSDSDYACVNDKLEQQLVHDEGFEDVRNAFIITLREWYLNVIDPVMSNDLAEFAARTDERPWRSDLEETFAFYGAWRLAIQDARTFLRDQHFTVRDVGPADAQAVAVLRAFADLMNQECDAEKDDPDPSIPVESASLGIRLPAVLALGYGLDASGNRLDLQTLIDGSCVQLIIDPGRDYSAEAPGDLGTVNVPTGFTIGGGLIRHDLPIFVKFSVHGQPTPFAQNATDANGTATAPLTWPDGVVPLRVDVLARLSMFDRGAEVSTEVARFDQITTQQLSFKFDSDLEGWSRGTAGSVGASNWGTVHWLSRDGGLVKLDGTGSPTRENAWLFKTFTLPADIQTLQFDVSAHDRLDSDTSFRVRIVVNGRSHTVVDTRLVHTGPEGDLSFGTQDVDIAPYAGETVTIYFEQNDNGLEGAFPGGDEEVYLDNIRLIDV
jgi:hypothetical protein